MPAMIKTVQLRQLKSVLETTIVFTSRLTVLVGPNGTGKTTILQGIEHLSSAAGGSNANLPGSMCTKGKPESLSYLEAKFGIAGMNGLVRFAWGQLRGSPINAIYPFCEPDPFPAALRDWGNGNLRMLLKYDRLVEDSKVHPKPKLNGEGANLASVLAELKLSQYGLFQKIVQLLGTIVPVADLNIKQLQDQKYGLFFDFEMAKDVPAKEVSMGTVFVLGIITMILGPNNPRLLLIDDLDHGLHPKAQMELIGLIRKLIDEVPDLQVIATTHSPYVLDCLKPNEVKVTGKAANGYSVCVPLEEHPDFGRWKDTMSPGEFWSYVGEGWIGKRTAGMEGVAVAP